MRLTSTATDYINMSFLLINSIFTLVASFQSFAKNMGLYGERVGAFHVLARSAELAVAVESNLTILIRANYSTPPKFGAVVASKIMTNLELFEEWQVCASEANTI